MPQHQIFQTPAAADTPPFCPLNPISADATSRLPNVFESRRLWLRTRAFVVLLRIEAFIEVFLRAPRISVFGSGGIHQSGRGRTGTRSRHGTKAGSGATERNGKQGAVGRYSPGLLFLLPRSSIYLNCTSYSSSVWKFSRRRLKPVRRWIYLVPKWILSTFPLQETSHSFDIVDVTIVKVLLVSRVFKERS
jgi:hypothetical protein